MVLNLVVEKTMEEAVRELTCALVRGPDNLTETKVALTLDRRIKPKHVISRVIRHNDQIRM
ncbi:MAG: hypothetical protein ACJAYU_002139 [Bradymonadia bacterium]|jgi:hypothetical protein